MRYVSMKAVLSFMVVICLLTGCAENDHEEAQRFIESARTFMAQNKPETAIIEYKNALSVDPENDVALFELAEVYIVTKKLNSAVRYYNLAIKANPTNTLPNLRLAQIYLQSEKLLDARNEVSAVLKKDPGAIAAYHILSGIQIKERDIESAIETLNKAISIDQNSVKTYIALAQLYIRTQKIKEATQAYYSAVAIDSASRDAYMGLVRIFAYQKKFDEIENLLLNVLETPGIKELKHTDLARFYEGQKRYDLAEEQFKKAVLEESKELFPLMNLAEFYTRRDAKKNAIETMENALSKNIQKEKVLTGLAQICLHFGMIEKADKAVNEALKKNNSYVDAIFQKGMVLLAKRDYKGALNHFDKVIAMNRIHARAYYYRALCINKSGATDRPEQKIFRAAAGMLDDPGEFERDQAKGNLLAAITVDPDLVEARIKLAEMYIVEKNIVKAKAQLEEIFKRQGPNLRIMTLLSGIHILEGNIEEAEKVLKVIIQKKPDYIPAYVRMGLLLKDTGKPHKALEYLKAAYENDPRQTGLVKIMSDVLVGERKYDQALDLVNQLSLAAAPETVAFFQFLKGDINYKNKKEDRAIVFFTKAIETKNDYIEPHMYLANILKKNNLPLKALEHYQAVEKIDPKYLKALLAIGIISDSLGRFNVAEQYYRKVLAINPKHPDASNNLSFLLSEKPEFLEEAFGLAKIAYEKKPKDPNVLDTMGWIYYQKGNYLSARHEIENSLKKNPDSALTCYHYGMTLYRLKEFEAARKYFNKALRLDPHIHSAEKIKEMLN